MTKFKQSILVCVCLSLAACDSPSLDTDSLGISSADSGTLKWGRGVEMGSGLCNCISSHFNSGLFLIKGR